MLSIKKQKLFINPLYKFLICEYVKKNLYLHESCIGNSASTFEVERRLHEKKLFKILATKIQNSVEGMIESPGHILSMWFNLSQKGGKISKHHHNDQKLPNKIAGAYYLKKPKNSGNLIVYDPNQRIIEVESDDIVIFDAFMLHETEINYTDKHRIVCGFNFLKLS